MAIPWFSWLLLGAAVVLLVVDLIGDGPEWANLGVLVLIGVDFVLRHRWRDPRMPWNRKRGGAEPGSGP
jgi:hypothetical protein